MEPRVHYARTRDGGNVAYTVTGNGPVLVWCQPYSHQHLEWRTEPMAGFYRALAESHTLVRYDGRGFGLSGLDGRTLSYGMLLDDLATVIDACAGDSFDLAAVSGLGFPAISYAAAHPDRVRRLVLWATPRKGMLFREGPRVRSMRAVKDIDGDLALELHARWLFGRGKVGERELEHARATLDVDTSEAYIEVLWQTDLADELARLTTPTLVLQPTGDSLITPGHSRDLAAVIQGAEFVLVDGDYYPYQAVDGDALIALINEFLGTPPRTGSGMAVNGKSSPLSKREAEVLVLLAAGQSNPEIARTLVLSPGTVDRHIQNIYGKLDVHNRVEAANWAREHGLETRE